jgi:WD40 repeat protein
MLTAARIRRIALVGGLLVSATGLSRQPPTVTSPEPAVPRRVDADGFPLPPGAVARLGSTRFRHRDLIQPVAFSPDGRTLYVGTAEHEALYVWDVGTGRLRWRVTFEERKPTDPRPGRSLDPRDIGFVGPEPAVVMPDRDGRECVVRFDPTSGKEAGRVRLDPPPVVKGYRFSRDGSRVAVSYDHNLAVYDTTTGLRVFARRGDYDISGVEGMDFSPDGRTLVVGDYKGGVHLLRADTGQPVLDFTTGNEHSPVCVRFALGGKVLVVRPMTTRWHPVLLVDAATGAVRHRLQTAGDSWGLWSAALAPDGKVLYTACRVRPESGGLGDYVVAWDVETGKELRRVPCALPFHTAVSPDGRMVVTADGHTVELLDAITGKALPQSSDPINGYAEFRAAPGGGWVGLSEVGVDTYDAAGRRVARFVPPATDATAWWGRLSPDGSRLVRVRNTLKPERVGPIEVWDTRAGKLLASFGREEANQPLPRLERDRHGIRGFSPDGRIVYTTRGVPSESVQAWDTTTGRPTAVPKGMDPRHGWVVFSPDGRWLATTREVKDTECDLREVPHEVIVLESATGRTVAVAKDVKPPRIHDVAFSPDGRLLAVVPSHQTEIINHLPITSDELVYLFELPSGREVGRLRGPDGSVERLAFSPDGRTIATAAAGRTARVWELATLRPRLSFPHARLPRVLAFSADGRVLAADGEDAPVYLWDVRGELDRPKNPPDAAALEKAWADLATEDAKAAFVAVRLLAAFPDRAVPFLRRKPAPAEAADPKQLRALVADLDHAVFAERERAAAELARYGAAAEPVLREAARSHTSAEVRKRAAALLDRIAAGKLTLDELRAVRVVEAVEWMGTPDSVKLLEAWAGGAAGARLTEEAKAALARIGRR